ncbi:ictacalcin-like isoform X2 [Anguilla rostrata]|uniref:Protein S100 n=1 Tax=Anguilla anguilla TaxID=7936 RepID=A0A9D3RV46_ANGAN|nr:ictacalcin-like isoform X2 [Anguilla anguilla]KAG5842861.1 hypothetical protein ANANG_G00182240 [Anguilla anguilla]
MSDIQQAMVMLITAFHKYSGKEGDPLTLTKNELKNLLQAELGEILGTAKDQSAVDKIFKELDRDGDNTVDFKEYIHLVCSLTMLCNEFFIKKK